MSNEHRDPRMEVVKMAMKDAAFRKELLADPNKAVEKTLGIKLPHGMTVKVVEDSAATVHLVLPSAGVPLSDKELAEVSGGAKSIFAPPTSPAFCNNTAPVSNCG